MLQQLNYTKTATAAWQRWLCYALCVCLWRGPLPILHAHSLELSMVAHSPVLADHARHFHADELGHGETGWHWHLVFPSEGSCFCSGHLDCGQTSHELQFIQSTSTVEQMDSLTVCTAAWFLGIENFRLVDTSGSRCADGAHDFLSSYRNVAPLCAILGVSRC